MKNLIRKIIINLRKLTPRPIIEGYHFFLALLGALIYRFPSKKIKVIGVTGTNGKSSTIEMIVKILEEGGHEVASSSSIKFRIGNKEKLNVSRMTMPGRFQIQKFLREAVDAECQYAVLEVTSEGIKQHRHKFIKFHTAVFTNLTPEHIEAHGGLENYKKAKGELFRATKKAHIINLDDDNADYFLRFPAEEKWGYGINFKGTDYKANLIKADNITGSDFKVRNTLISLSLFGNFNIYNSLAAICVGLSEGVGLETAETALEKIKNIPGRMEEVISEPFRVFIDYAFTPNALEKVYRKLKPEKGRMIGVLGSCGGGRDKWKRKVLGGIAYKYCDDVIVTNEDPYDENPEEIIDQVLEGCGDKAKKIIDRREAIRTALSLARDGDVVVITGKGCEPSICLAGGESLPWSEKEVIKEELEKLKQKV